MKYLDGKPWHSAKAVQVWPFLQLLAASQATATYKTIGKLISLPPQSVSASLRPLAEWCKRKGLPPFTIVIVHSGDSKPGDGLDVSGAVDDELEAVWMTDWFAVEPPSVQELDQLLSNLDSNDRA